MANDRPRKEQDRENLRNIVNQWNANRLDLFELSEPNEDLEFHGVMRFYFQDDGQKVATKCIRVSSTGTTKDVILTLIEKFRPDMRMLSVPQYALYEIHENGEERKLASEEKPLLVQLNWHKDDREGRFLLRRMDQKTRLPSMDKESSHFKRKLSKREKKEKRKKEKKEKAKNENNNDKIAEKLYTELPETSFTRSISNPEAVMRRRRQQKLERKLQQFRNQDDAAGGTLKIFGESLCRDVPYRTLLLSLKDTAVFVVREILEKYGFEKADPTFYCLVQHIVPHPIQGNITGSMKDYHNNSSGPKEYILDDDDCPLAIDTNFPKSKGVLTFHVKRRPADYQPRKRKKKPKQTKGELEQQYRYDDFADRLPFLLELNPDGSDIKNGMPKKYSLHLNVTEVGCERSHATGTGQHLQLFGPNVQPRHCVLAHTEGIVTVTPSSRDAETYVNGIRIYETTILQHGIVVRFGKIHNFRFIDPIFEEKRCLSPDPRHISDSFYDRSSIKEDQVSIHGSIHQGNQPANFETTFDVDGNVETISTHSSQMIMPQKNMDSDRISRKSDDLSRNSVRMDGRGRGCDPILPAVLEFKEEGEDRFLSAVTSQVDTVHTQFKLAPTYALYMAARYRASTHYRPDSSPNERAHRLTSLMNKVSSLIQLVVQESQSNSSSLAFWMANSSELLHFLKQDRHLSAYTIDAQDVLAEGVQVAFRSLVSCLQIELQQAMYVFLEDVDDIHEEEGTTADVLNVLAAAMSLLRRCRVNAALTIQLFSQLFHFINMWVFNRIVCNNRYNFCSHLWGVRLKRRLARVEIWAEKQGLELAADCHLSRIVQAAHLLQAPKNNPDDISDITSACFKLNSLQLRALLERYVSAPDEPPMPPELIPSVVKIAENTADELTKSDGRDVRLEEDHELQLPFLLPEDGYSCDIVRGVPAGLQEFLYPHITAGLCRMAVQPTSSGYWTIYMSDQDIGRPTGARSPSVKSNRGDGDVGAPSMGKGSSSLPKEPEVVVIKLKKGNNGMGLSIVAAKGAGQDKLGIYIKSVVKGGAADMDGRLQAGDQLLKVDGHSLVGISQEKAAEFMTRTGSLVNLEVARQGAIYHGLATLLNQPSPVMHRGPGHPGPRRMSERNLNQPPPDERMYNGKIQSSKSVPTLYNAEDDQAPQNNPDRADPRHHEMPNPGFGHNPSIPKSASADFNLESQVRPISANSMRPEGHFAHPPPPAPSSGGPPPYCEQDTEKPSHRPNPHLKSEETHYQNISQYQQQQTLPSSSIRTTRPPMNDFQVNKAKAHPHMHPPHQNMVNSAHLQSPSPGPPPPGSNGYTRPISTLVSQREQDQYSRNNVSDQNYQGPVPGPKNPRYASTPEINEHQQPGHDPNMWNSRSTPQPNEPVRAASRNRDVIRQEAKMEEMHEEVQRREEWLKHGYGGQINRGPPMPHEQTIGPPQRPPPPDPYQQYHPVSPGGPRPMHRPVHQQMGHPPNELDRARMNQQYRDSPPPPPPPANTHPLMQPRQSYPGPESYNQQTLPPYPVHGAHLGGGPPLRLPPHPEQGGATIPGISPWKREEKEKMQQRKIDEARNMRDREIGHLENLEQLTDKQEERLRTLRLEKEFQRRAEELNHDEEEDDDDEKSEDSKMKGLIQSMSNSQLDVNKLPPPPAQQPGFENESVQGRMYYSRNMTPQEQWLARKQQEKQMRDQIYDVNNDDDKNRIFDEVSKKKEMEMAAMRELQAAKEAEDKLLQEARRRQVEEHRNIQNYGPPMQNAAQGQQQQPSFSHQRGDKPEGHALTSNEQLYIQQNHPEYSSAPNMPPQYSQQAPPSNVQYRSVYQPQRSHRNEPPANPQLEIQAQPLNSVSAPPPSSGAQRLDSLLMINSKSALQPPQPPERKSSYEITAELSPNNPNVNPQGSIKKVSFSNTKVEMETKFDSNGNQENIKNSNHSTHYSESIMTPPSSPPTNNLIIGSTPGVIGAQEVYRDPRKHIQEQRGRRETRGPSPEELSFKDKMKKFALEAGQPESPRDRVKISRAQREIETKGKVNGQP